VTSRINYLIVLVLQGVYAFQAEQSKQNAASRLSQPMETTTSIQTLFYFVNIFFVPLTVKRH
jgi:hypothetical protein